LYFPFFPPSIYGFWLPLWYLQSFRNSNTSGVTNGAGTTHLAEYLSAPPFKWGSCCTMFSLLYSIMSTIICLFLRPLYCLSFKVRCLITPFGHCIVCSSSKYGVWLPLLAIVLSVLQSTASDYPLWPLYCLFFFKVLCLITPFGHCIVCSSSKYGVWLPPLAIVLSVLLQSTASDYPLWPLYCLSFEVRRLITPFGHCIVCPSKYGVWLPPLAIVLSVLLQSTVSDYPLWPL
jgi:predicted nucleic acid-binding Zn ribbon protein